MVTEGRVYNAVLFISYTGHSVSSQSTLRRVLPLHGLLRLFHIRFYHYHRGASSGIFAN